MKSFLALSSLLVLVSLACSASRSVGPERVVNHGVEIQSTSTPSNVNQEKQPCTLTLAGAPSIRGLRLGITPNEVLELFSGSKDDAEVRASMSAAPTEFGVSNFVIRPAQYGSKDKFAGINQISLNLLDGRVAALTIGYDGPAYSHVDRFVEMIVKETSLPPMDQWEGYVGMDNQLKILRCKEFEVQAFVGGQGGNLNYVQMKDLMADKKLKDRRAKAREKSTPETQ